MSNSTEDFITYVQPAKLPTVFFGLPAKRQVSLLPTLEERKYNFPSGDWVTSSPLSVLLLAYESRLNASIIFLPHPDDEREEFENFECKVLATLAHNLFEVICGAGDNEKFNPPDDMEKLMSSRWERIRQLSSDFSESLNFNMELSPMLVREYVDSFLHP